MKRGLLIAVPVLLAGCSLAPKTVLPPPPVPQSWPVGDAYLLQSEAALRNLASRYRYDGREEDGFSLRGHIDEVAGQLKQEVQDRCTAAGVEVLEARISHLAYAPEVAGLMLQRQQAAALVAARRLIVDAAVGMVEHALTDLAAKGLVDLDPERKAVMVSNLMVVLCGDQPPSPIVNTGSLYT